MTTTHEPPTPASTSVAPPRVDLRLRAEQRRVVDVHLRADALQRGIRTNTCPQCGVNPAGAPSKKTFSYVPPWIYITLLISVLFTLILYVALRRQVKGDVSLCADCDKADIGGRSLRSASWVGLLLFPAAFAGAGGVFFGAEAAAAGALVGVVSGVAGVVAAHRSTRFDVVSARFIDAARALLTLRASESFERVLAAEAPDALAAPPLPAHPHGDS